MSIRMNLVLLILTLLAPALWAQTTLSRGQEPATQTSIIIDRQVIRFITPGESLEWRLAVSNQQGEVVFDSGFVYGAALEWPLKNQQDEALQSGLYAYTLTRKEPNNEQTRTQHGHLIVDRASSSDRVWLTSSQAVGIGSSEAPRVSVIGSREATIGGVELPSNVPRREASAERPELPTRATAGAAEKVAEPTIVNGTANRVAKFAADGVSLVDSGISEVGGNVGIGTTTPAGGFDYRGSTAAFYTRDIGTTNGGTPQSALQLGVSNLGSRNVGVGPSMLFFADNSAGNKSFLGRVSAAWENPTAGAEAGALRFQVRANSGDVNALIERMRISSSGNVGIGTSAPGAKLDVIAAEPFGIFGRNSTGFGVFGQTFGPAVAGVLGRYDGPNDSGGGWGVFGWSERGYAGVFGSGFKNGVFGRTSSAGDSGVYGRNDGNGWGVFGSSHMGEGVFGEGWRNGVRGRTGSAIDSGVWGENTAYGYGVAGSSVNGVGVVGDTTNGFAMQARGNTVQSREKGGWVKAMAYVDPQKATPGNLNAAIVRCYNSQTTVSNVSTSPCGFNYGSTNTGYYTIDFGFNVGDRFVSLTLDCNCVTTISNYEPVMGYAQFTGARPINYIQVVVFRPNGDPVNSAFYLIVY